MNLTGYFSIDSCITDVKKMDDGVIVTFSGDTKLYLSNEELELIQYG